MSSIKTLCLRRSSLCPLLISALGLSIDSYLFRQETWSLDSQEQSLICGMRKVCSFLQVSCLRIVHLWIISSKLTSNIIWIGRKKTVNHSLWPTLTLKSQKPKERILGKLLLENLQSQSQRNDLLRLEILRRNQLESSSTVCLRSRISPVCLVLNSIFKRCNQTEIKAVSKNQGILKSVSQHLNWHEIRSNMSLYPPSINERYHLSVESLLNQIYRPTTRQLRNRNWRQRDLKQQNHCNKLASKLFRSIPSMKSSIISWSIMTGRLSQLLCRTLIKSIGSRYKLRLKSYVLIRSWSLARWFQRKWLLLPKSSSWERWKVLIKTFSNILL